MFAPKLWFWAERGFWTKPRERKNWPKLLTPSSHSFPSRPTDTSSSRSPFRRLRRPAIPAGSGGFSSRRPPPGTAGGSAQLARILGNGWKLQRRLRGPGRDGAGHALHRRRGRPRQASSAPGRPVATGARRSQGDAVVLMWDPRAEVVTAMDSDGRPSPAVPEFVLYAPSHAEICRYKTSTLSTSFICYYRYQKYFPDF